MRAKDLFRPRFLLPLLLSAAAACTGSAGAGDDSTGDDSSQPPPATLASIAHGLFQPIAPYTGISGQAVVARRLDGKTEVSISVAGVAPVTTYAAHVHSQPCAYQGGGHYKIDPLVVDPVETNELWLAPASNATGVANAAVTFEHLARGEALSIVVHDPVATGAKMACADLYMDDDPAATVVLSGTLAPLQPAQALDAPLVGQVGISRTAVTTQLTLQLSGLDAASIYGAHLHAEPCAIDNGGGHYKMNPSITTTDPANEIWFMIGDHAAGTQTVTLTVPHSIRTDAQSVVVHRTDAAGMTPKVGCTDLARTTAQRPLVTSGAAVPIDAAVVTGGATMIRTLSGTTQVRLEIAGLVPSTAYKAHVHDQPCAVENGGAHYMINKEAAAGEANELWLDVMADAAGAGADELEVSHLARAEAQSIVVHGAASARLACIDLR